MKDRQVIIFAALSHAGATKWVQAATKILPINHCRYFYSLLIDDNTQRRMLHFDSLHLGLALKYIWFRIRVPMIGIHQWITSRTHLLTSFPAYFWLQSIISAVRKGVKEQKILCSARNMRGCVGVWSGGFRRTILQREKDTVWFTPPKSSEKVQQTKKDFFRWEDLYLHVGGEILEIEDLDLNEQSVRMSGFVRTLFENCEWILTAACLWTPRHHQPERLLKRLESELKGPVCFYR